MADQPPAVPSSDPPFSMKLNLNVLNHLGINLYSNVPAVLSEVVANSWDADSEAVRITVASKDKTVTIEDDGVGMTKDDVNQRYLHVGYQRRIDPKGLAVTAKWKRPVMGRKGIGKLSLFSIANIVKVYTTKNGTTSGLEMNLEDIKKVIGSGAPVYHPTELPPSATPLKAGTRIVLEGLKKDLWKTPGALRKRLARRFSVLGASQHFQVFLDGKEVTVEDRGYFDLVQYGWTYGNGDRVPDSAFKKAVSIESRANVIEVEGTKYSVSGWLGTVTDSGTIKETDDDSLNRIVIGIRGKIAQEDILGQFPEGGVYSKYLMGELRADFLDLDLDDDIATTSRQQIIEDDPRYRALRTFVWGELKHIQNKWTELRNEKGFEKAIEVPAVKEWYGTLGKDQKAKAKNLFGKIYRIASDDPNTRTQLLKNGILAFEILRYRANLDALESVDANDLPAFTKLFTEMNDLEATYYHQIVSQRLLVITALKSKVAENQKEKVLQDHVYHNLWLLDTSWDRGNESPHLEASVATAFKNVDAGLTKEEADGRFDIRYKTAAGKHIIVELKRADRLLTVGALMDQCKKYITALRKVLDKSGEKDAPIEAVCIVGKPLKGWESREAEEADRTSLEKQKIRVKTYDELILNAELDYKQYLDKHKEAGRILTLLNQIDAIAEKDE